MQVYPAGRAKDVLILKNRLAPLRVLAVFSICATFISCGASALAATPFDALLGTWSGSGKIRYHSGEFERVRCSAYYRGGGQNLSLAIRCKSTSRKIEVRGRLLQRGNRVSGTWEERTFNASGEAQGRITSRRMHLSITGGGLSGSMSVTYSRSRQAVVIATRGIGMKSITVNLRR
jgi:hypothetical protein